MSRRCDKINRLRLNGSRCVYCGESATTDEHFPPFSVNPVSGFILPACFECNGIASNKHAYNFKNRVEYVKSKIKRKNRDVLCLPQWQSYEINALDGNLKRMVSFGIELKRKTISRFEFDTLSYLALIDKDESFLRFTGYITQSSFALGIEPMTMIEEPIIKVKRKRAPQKKRPYKPVDPNEKANEIKHNYVGVIFSRGKYNACVYENGRRLTIGTFDTPEEALVARRIHLKLEINSPALFYGTRP